MQHSLLIGLWNLYNFPYDNPLSPYTILNQVMADTEALILFIKKYSVVQHITHVGSSR
jgi:hypothetical protein